MKRKILFFLTSFLLLFNANRVIRMKIAHGKTPEIFCREGYSTMIILPETVKRVFIGAISSWAVVVREDKVVLRPIEKVDTNLIVELSSGKALSFRLKVIIEKERADDVIKVLLKEQPEIHEIVPPAPSHKKDKLQQLIQEFNFRYIFKNSERISIKNVMDDGKFTYVVFHPGSKIGVVYLCKGGFLKRKKKEVINFSFAGNVMKIDRILKKGEFFEITYSKEKAVIRRNK